VVKKSQEFLVTMAWFAQRNDFAIEHVKRGEQGVVPWRK
jgi:hypothetical protein